MKKKKNKKLALLLILVLVISVGYAALASNLKINGSSNVKASSWNVYWDNVQIKDGSVPADNNNKARITDSAKTQVEFNVVLSEPGDFYEFTVDAVNNGTIDAMIAKDGIVNGVYSDNSYTTPATLPEAVSYTVTYADGTTIEPKHLLAKKNGSTPTKETYKVRIEYRNDDEIDPDDLDNDNDHTYYFKFSVNYVQADSTAEPSHQASAIRYVKRQNTGQITPGDVIGIGETEDFYVISSNSEKTVLLAKYNLLVGNIVEDWDVVGRVQTSTQGYGLQSTDAICSYNTGFGSGSVAFSATNYWNNLDNGYAKDLNGNPADYEGNPYPYVYDNSYISMPDFNNDGFETSGYSVAYYVEQYKARLIEMGAPSTITGRLLSYEEAVASIQIEDNGNSIINSLYYWLGSVTSDNDFIFPIDSYWNSSSRPYNEEGYLGLGVRPVIEIPTSEIK